MLFFVSTREFLQLVFAEFSLSHSTLSGRIYAMFIFLQMIRWKHQLELLVVCFWLRRVIESPKNIA